MTEDEARTKWCPFVRVAAGAMEWHTNRPSIADVDAKPFDLCIASACMAWRWLDTHVPNPADPQGELIRSTRDHGACGLAGPWFQNYRSQPERMDR